MKPTRFNIRVYLVIREDGFILLSDERIKGGCYVKLPGGGLEFGEGPRACAMREAKEELGQEVEIVKQVYTTEDFVQSKFNKQDQVIAIYYEAKLRSIPRFRISDKMFDFVGVDKNKDEESFRWAKWESLKPEDLSFHTDQALIRNLKKDTCG